MNFYFSSLTLTRLVVLTSAFFPFALPQIAQSESVNSAGVVKLTLDEAVNLALSNNPGLSASAEAIAARAGAALQAGLYPNPEFAVEIENFAGSRALSGFDGAETTVSLRQLIELGGKRGKRKAAAELEGVIAVEEYEVVRLETVSQTTKAFFKALAIQERERLMDAVLKGARMSMEIAAAQVKAGGGSVVDALRTEVELGELEALREKLHRDLQAAYIELAASWGGSTSTFTVLTGDLYAVRPPPSLEAQLQGLSDSSYLRRWRAEEQHGKAIGNRERANSVPDITAAIGGRRFEEEEASALVAEVSIPLPVFDRNQGAIEEADRRLNRVKAERKQAEVLAESSLRSLHEQAAGAFSELERLRSSIIPKAERALEGAQEGYRRGVFRALEVLDTQRTLFELKSHYLETLADYHAIQAEMLRFVSQAASIN